MGGWAKGGHIMQTPPNKARPSKIDFALPWGGVRVMISQHYEAGGPNVFPMI